MPGAGRRPPGSSVPTRSVGAATVATTKRTSTQLGDGAELLMERYKGDLRRLREDTYPKKLLREIPGIGPAGVNIFRQPSC